MEPVLISLKDPGGLNLAQRGVVHLIEIRGANNDLTPLLLVDLELDWAWCLIEQVPC